MPPSIIIASENLNIREVARATLIEEKCDPILCGDGLEAYESALHASKGDAADIKLMILDMFLPKMDGFEVVAKLQDQAQTKDIPILMLTEKKEGINFQTRLRADNYLQKPFTPLELQSEVHSMIKHFRKHRGPHPITGLEGHPQLEQEIFNRLGRGENFYALWMDINYFRPFNDHYGTEKGNLVLKTFVALIRKTLQSMGNDANTHLTHIDGDDFILLSGAPIADSLKNSLRTEFQKEALSFYSDAEREKGFIYQKSRENKDQIYPLMRLSMALLKITPEEYSHYGQFVSRARELLHQTKIGAQDVK